MASYTLKVNGRTQLVTLQNPDIPLLWVLRDYLGLTGTKYGCGIEICAACTVLIDGKPQKSCELNLNAVVGKAIMTVEGLAADVDWAKAQAAWVTHQVPHAAIASRVC